MSNRPMASAKRATRMKREFLRKALTQRRAVDLAGRWRREAGIECRQDPSPHESSREIERPCGKKPRPLQRVNVFPSATREPVGATEVQLNRRDAMNTE